jgi:hypothetical protein
MPLDNLTEGSDISPGDGLHQLFVTQLRIIYH